MKKISLITITIVILSMIVMFGCGDDNVIEPTTEPTTTPGVTIAPTQEPTKAPFNGYTVRIVDENNELIKVSAMVQLCADSCIPAPVVDGVAQFNVEDNTYKVSFLSLPEGYTYIDEKQEFYFDGGSKELTIVLKAE